MQPLLEPPRDRSPSQKDGTSSVALVPPQPPDDDEKYCYVQRNLLYLTTILVIGSGCLIVSQVRFEAHNPALWPFMVFTATYVIYQVISLPVNFTGRGIRPGCSPGAHPGVAPALLPERGHPPAHLRRADRGAPQHLEGRSRPGRGL